MWELPPRSRRRRWFVVASIALALAMALCFSGSALVVNEPIEKPDVIVSLSSHEWERLPETARLAGQFPHARILLTRPPIVSRYNCHDCEHRVDFLVSQGVARDRIDVILLGESSTRGEAEAVHAVVRGQQYQRVLLVTSTYHTRRALRTFRRLVGGDAAIGIVPAGVGTFARPTMWWSRAYDRWYVTYEWAAMIRDVGRGRP